jgi:hypothetical protein
MDAAEIELSHEAVSFVRSVLTSDIGQRVPGVKETAAGGIPLAVPSVDYELFSQASVRFGQPVFFST